MSSLVKTQIINKKAASAVAIKVSPKTFAGIVSSKPKAKPKATESDVTEPLIKIFVHPGFVKPRRGRDRIGFYRYWVVEGNLEREKRMRPEFNSIPDLLDYLERYHDIEFIVCPHSLKKGYETLVPTLPGTLFKHLKKHHRDVLKKLGIDPNSYSPVIWSHQERDYSTPALERQKRSKAMRTMSYARGRGKSKSKSKSKVTITKKDVDTWPELGSSSAVKAKANTKRKSHQRKKTLELRDKDGNELDSISSSNVFSSLASDDEEGTD